jgi:hypothetical protein
MLEKNITNKIMKYLKSQDYCFCFKEHGGRYGTSGVPDIICCYRGKFIAFEVKTPDGKLTRLQQETIDKINAAGGKAFKVTGVDEVESIIESLKS